MRFELISAFVLTVSLMGCASVPVVQGQPEDIADRIGANAVAYNQAYGRAIADQVLLNVLRARDRLPLYYLSMSGITEGSEVQIQHQLGIGSINLGSSSSPWGVGTLNEQRTTITKPSYTLNPFSSGGDNARARQFQQVAPEIFQHFWDSDWPRQMLLLIMVDDLVKDGETSPVENNSSCNSNANAKSKECAFLREASEITEGTLVLEHCHETAPRPSTTPGAPAANNADESTPAAPEDCSISIAIHGSNYRLHLRAVDDMIYFVGSLMRGYSEAEDMAARIDAVQVQGHAPLFRIVRSRSRQEPGYYAAEVTYRGARYYAGPANDNICNLGACPNDADANDGSSRVLSLLTQLIVIGQSEEAQLGPRQIITR